MNAQTVGWLVFLAIIKNISYGKPMPFQLDVSPLTATEGSCIEIKCTVTQKVHTVSAYWFWIKDGRWDKVASRVVNGTVIYSTDAAERPVSADFADRVNYIGSPSPSWNSYSATPKSCSILICDLKKTDNGDYSFRFVGKVKWMTRPVRLEVKENPCPITFEEPPAVNEFDTVTLTCSTLMSCPSNPQIGDLTQLSPTQFSTPQHNNANVKSTTVSLTVRWQDHGKEFSCQTDDRDKYIIRNISLTVEYAPKDISAQISIKNIVENKSVTLTCSAKGRPDPNFTWFNNRKEVIGTKAVWNITSIKESQKGEYICEARNKQGTIKSNPVNIIVTYMPEVEVTSPASTVRQGNKMTLMCNVKRSNPQPHTYVWSKDGNAIRHKQSQQYVVERIEPEDSGLYKCSASNTVGTRYSKAFNITVEYGPRKTTISISENDKRVGVGKSLTFYCNTKANPAPVRFSWHRYDSKTQQWKSKTTKEKKLRLDTVKRADEACYVCNATNHIDTGEDSEPVCIQVLYAPTELALSMDTEVREGGLITIRCTVESFPPSTLTLKQISDSNPQTSKLLFTQPDDWVPNTLQHSFNVTSMHTGSYTCHATNSEGSKTSERRELVVKCE
ncbi:B-cell receptor CD22 [Cyclopterus lumpus]|uniref:B-cell receptor CD22 n=1 Tax=Cyclopterus lumpus TaxID=8103 RepID=UPI001486BC6F|nr:B-cell receptor CD22 [Cyclopterus lumpus]